MVCVTEELCRAQFLIPVSTQGQNRAQASLERAQYLNPMVEVCLTGCSRDLMVRVDQLCAQHNIKVFCGDVFGYHGYMFSDLGQEHNYVEEKPKVVKPKTEESNDGPEAKNPKVDHHDQKGERCIKIAQLEFYQCIECYPPPHLMMSCSLPFGALSIPTEQTASFCSLKVALEVDWTNEKAKSSLTRTPVDYFLLHVLLKFRTDKGRDPHPQSFKADATLLRQIRDDALEAMGLSSELLPHDFVRYCFSEMAPVCAVVGGVLGQEVVKAISQRDAPHKNFFFDGMKGSGVVDYFGPSRELWRIQSRSRVSLSQSVQSAEGIREEIEDS
ncbi:unnamed protein product [Coregonus sp. 'balchen']|nr:unnamed protein product [Coregonus sp. 'balchen']